MDQSKQCPVCKQIFEPVELTFAHLLWKHPAEYLTIKRNPHSKFGNFLHKKCWEMNFIIENNKKLNINDSDSSKSDKEKDQKDGCETKALVDQKTCQKSRRASVNEKDDKNNDHSNERSSSIDKTSTDNVDRPITINTCPDTLLGASRSGKRDHSPDNKTASKCESYDQKTKYKSRRSSNHDQYDRNSKSEKLKSKFMNESLSSKDLPKRADHSYTQALPSSISRGRRSLLSNFKRLSDYKSVGQGSRPNSRRSSVDDKSDKSTSHSREGSKSTDQSPNRKDVPATMTATCPEQLPGSSRRGQRCLLPHYKNPSEYKSTKQKTANTGKSRRASASEQDDKSTMQVKERSKFNDDSFIREGVPDEVPDTFPDTLSDSGRRSRRPLLPNYKPDYQPDDSPPTNSKIYKCHWCSQLFTRAEKAANHDIDVHQKPFSFICGTCSSEYPNPKAMADHMIAEHDQLRCCFCGLYFQLERPFIEHMYEEYFNEVLTFYINQQN